MCRDYTSEGKVLSPPTWAKSCMSTLYCQLAIKHFIRHTLTCDVGSVEHRSVVSATASVIISLVFPPGFESGVNFRVGMVIMIPFWASAASLVRMRSRELSLRRSNGVHQGDGKKNEWQGLTWLRARRHRCALPQRTEGGREPCERTARTGPQSLSAK